jgi:Zn-dependent protease with chaperone function
LSVDIYLPLALSLVLAVSSRPLSNWLRPAESVPLLALAGLVTALATGFSLCVLTFTTAAQFPAIAALGHWSVGVLQAAVPLPLPVAWVAGMAVASLLFASARRMALGGQQLWAARQVSRDLGGQPRGLVVVDEDRAEAYAVPGAGGRIVVSTAMLYALRGPERRVLLEHEVSHLRHRHHLYVFLAELSAAANPLLRPLAAAVHAGVERWADEDAAAAVGDRTLAARALAKAGIAHSNSLRSGSTGLSSRLSRAALPVADHGTVGRVRALLAPEPARRTSVALVLALSVVIAGAGTIDVARDADSLFHAAQTPAATGQASR